MHQRIVMCNVVMCVSILQIKYRCINTPMYCCVLINKMFSVMEKSFKMTFCRRKTLVQYDNRFGSALEEISYHFHLPKRTYKILKPLMLLSSDASLYCDTFDMTH